MKLMSRAILLATVLTCRLSALEIGDPPPPLNIAEWVQGDKVELTGQDSKTVYVIEFWATWCPPCRTTIPHLTDLHLRLKNRGVQIVSISNEDASKVKDFVKQMGQRMAYTVAVDADSGTTRDYLGAFGVSSIPHAFVIDKHGRIAWHGHPMALDDVLNLVLADTFDPDLMPTADTAVQHARDYLSQARQGKSKVELAKLGPGVIREADKNVDLLNHLAWTILTDTRIKTRDVAMAVEAAKVAVDTTESTNPFILDTYAKALFESGQKQEALATQKKAIELAGEKRLKAKLETALHRYEEKSK